MGPKKDSVWDQFHEPYIPEGGKAQKAVCKLCQVAIGAAATRLRQHYIACPKRPRSIGQLELGVQAPPRKKVATSTQSSHVTTTSATSSKPTPCSECGTLALSSTFSNGRVHFDYLTKEEHQHVVELFGRAIHQTAMAFQAFEHLDWDEFFHTIHGSFKRPTIEAIGGDLMQLEYKNIMFEVMRSLKQLVMICLTLDGGTNIQGKQVINMMACSPMAFFLEHFTMELCRESADNLYCKLMDCKRRLLLTIRNLAPGFQPALDLTGDSDSCNKHFVNAPMFSFCSDLSSVMVKLRRLCIQDDEFVFAFGCALHVLHNLCMDLVKEFPGIKNIVKHMVFLVKTIRKTHLIQQQFDKVSKEKYGQTLVLILFTKKRWGTRCDAAKRLNRVRTAICQLPTEILSNELDIDLAPELRNIILDVAFWKGLAALEVLFSTICPCLTYFEGDESTLSSVYACFLAIAHHLRTLPPNVSTALQIAAADFDKMQSLVVNRLRTIYSPAHALSFHTDPLFNQMRTNLTALYGEDFLKLGGASILQQCKKALKRLVGESGIKLNRKLQAEFGHYIVRVIQDNDDFADVLAKP
jgi:hypothetical protein